MLSFETVKTILNDCVRQELRDHAFGDAEVFWAKDGREIAGGYFGGGSASVWVSGPNGSSLGSFEGEEARELRKCGTLDHVERNDEMGPDTYQEGYVMPGLTKEAVFIELTKRPERN